MKNKELGNGTIGMAVLTAIFALLKFAGIIDWSWPWVLSPVLINLGIISVFVGLCAVMSLAD